MNIIQEESLYHLKNQKKSLKLVIVQWLKLYPKHLKSLSWMKQKMFLSSNIFINFNIVKILCTLVWTLQIMLFLN